MVRLLILMPTLVLMLSKISAQDQHLQVDTTTFYQFHINYWFNMHHFLWLEAFMNMEVDSSLIDKKLTSEKKEAFKSAVDFYKKGLVKEDLRTSDYMTSFKEWITGPAPSIEQVPTAFEQHMSVLKAFDQVYKEVFWPKQKVACQKVLAENLDLIRKTEEDFVHQITTLTRQFWQSEKVRVDVTYYAKSTKWNLRNRPYTSIFPTHVVMNVVGDNEIPGNWLELLYHESAHPLILSSSYFVGGTIKDLAEVEGLKPPSQLWHAYLFYFTGEVTKKLLTKEGVDYPITYMERNRVFSRYLPLLHKHLKPYMERKLTLIEATRNFMEDYRK